ncbi:MAG: hypothetical protein ACI865_002221 [Flavobacteriaceae bacterium]|jgi:hypothetical protein
MDGLENYKAKLHALGELMKKMEAGSLSISELSDLETLTRELHERSIILKYKAFEAKVKQDTPIKEDVQPVDEVIEEEIPIVEVEDEEDDVDSGGLDFALFDTPEEVIVPEPIEEVKAVEKEVIVETPQIAKVEEIIIEAPVEEINVDLSAPVDSDESKKSFLDRLNLPPESVSSQFSESKIDSLSGAFGLNEKLRFIRELFAGSSDLFSEAISSLDSQSSIGDASVKVEELAFSNSWDLEQDAVLEFMSIIKRRYA